MNQKGKKVIILTVILLSAIWLINLQSGVASKTLNVPGDYATISAALSHASDGNTIAVASGVYHENLQINKSVSVIGENSQTTILIGAGGVDRGAQPVVALNAPNTKISGFTIESQNYTSTNFYATGVIINADYCTIQNNVITNNYMGIFCSVQSYLEITGNTIADNLKDGMRFFGGSYNTISGNTITGNAVSGIALQGYSNTVTNNTVEYNLRALGLGSSYSVVFGNKFAFNTESGIWLAASHSIIAANDIANNKWGVFISPQMGAPHNNTFYQNNFVDNIYAVYVNQSAPTNFWDSGAVGNYWSDYQSKYPSATEKGTSGIANTPYLVYAGAQDNYPLINQFDLSRPGTTPAANPPSTNAPNGLVAYWPFDTVDLTGVSPDSTGNNPAILGSTMPNVNKSYVPVTVGGEAGKALAFDGQMYISVPASPSLEISGEVTVDAWINAQAYKPIPYNNILVECQRTTAALPTRTFGFSINGEAPQNSSAPVVGALRGYVLTTDGQFNEIVTTQPVVPLNQWIHVVFTRSLTTGMHIYVDGKEQEVKVTSGVANPQGAIVRQTENYIGHDAICTIDELKLSNTAESPAQPLWMQWWLWTVLFAAVAAAALVFYGWRRSKAPKPSKP